jgi:antitoxin CptB
MLTGQAGNIISGAAKGASAMTESLDILRRKLRFRAWHRGTKEADLMMGRFADSYLEQFGAEELEQFSALLEETDLDVYGWVIGREPVPEAHRTPVMDLLQQFDFTVEGLR